MGKKDVPILPPNEVQRIRDLAASGMQGSKIAKLMGVSTGTVSLIINGKIHKDVDQSKDYIQMSEAEAQRHDEVISSALNKRISGKPDCKKSRAQRAMPE